MADSKNKIPNTGYALKGFLILCVLFGHSISMINGIRNVAWYDSIVNIFLTSFEMPMFTLVSGYYLGSSLSRHSAMKVALRRTISIGSTLLCWVVIPTIVKELFINHDYGVVNIFRIVVSNTAGGKLWYLFSYLFSSLVLVLIVGFTKRFFNKSTKVEVIALLCTIVLVSVCGRIPGHSPFLFPFFVVGYWFYRFSIINKIWFPNLLIVGTGLFVLLIPLYVPEMSFYMLSPAIVNVAMLPQAIFRTALGFAGCATSYVIVKKVISSEFSVRLEHLGIKSLSLYIISMYIQEPMRDLLMLVPFRNNADILTDFSVVGFGVLFCIVLIGICLLFDKLLLRVKPLYKILLS